MIFPSSGKYSAGNTNFIFSSLINELLQMNFMIINILQIHSLLLFQSTYFFTVNLDIKTSTTIILSN